ncbi:MAG: hypothetical protein WBC60_13580 [Cognaticolwellia sp.]|jgi:hypothetical protein
MKKLNAFTSAIILPCLLMSGLGVTAEQNNDPYADMHKQLSIMSDIIKSSVSDKPRGQHSTIKSIESSYLRGQGVVFIIHSANNNRQWGNYNFNFSMPEMPSMPEIPIAPLAPEVNKDFHENYDIDINQTVTHALESASVGYERAMQMFEENRDKTRELREEQRDLAYSLRDVEREKRDLNYQLSRASSERKVELKQDLDKLAEQEEKLREQQQKITQLTRHVEAEQKAEQEKKIKERISYYQQLSLKLTETLCLYGNGLKALPKNEHVSVILKSAGDKSARRYKDSVLVFSKEDISRCSGDKITAAMLMDKAQAYQF